MLKENRSQFAIIFFLILVGAWFMLDRLFPEFNVITSKYTQLPGVLILIGGIILFFGFVLGEAGTFVPSMVILGLGEIITYQNSYGGFSSGWFMWTLLPVFIGAGMILAAVFEEEDREQNIKHGFTLLGIGAIFFIILARFFGDLRLFGI